MEIRKDKNELEISPSKETIAKAIGKGLRNWKEKDFQSAIIYWFKKEIDIEMKGKDCHSINDE